MVTTCYVKPCAQDPTDSLRETAYLCGELQSTMALAKAFHSLEQMEGGRLLRRIALLIAGRVDPLCSEQFVAKCRFGLRYCHARLEVTCGGLV